MPRSWKTDSLPHVDTPNRLGRGDVKLLLLSVLEGGPRHGYELMKAVEQLSGGRYIPSAGVVYPTLRVYSEQGLLKAEQSGDRRAYGLTPPGKKYLHARREALATALKRLRNGSGEGKPELRALTQETQRLVHELFEHTEQLGSADIAALRRVIAEARARVKRVLE